MAQKDCGCFHAHGCRASGHSRHLWDEGSGAVGPGYGLYDRALGGVFFLCDDKAVSAITGVVLPIDAGFAVYSGV